MYLFQRTRSGCIGLAGLVAVTLASPAAVRAQQVVVPPAAEAVVPPGAQLLMSRIQAGLALDRYLELLRNDFFQIDADVDGKITQRDVDFHMLMEGNQSRSSAITFIMRFDLDGDGLVTEDEIRRTMNYDMRMQLAQAAFNNMSRPQLPSMSGPEKQIENTIQSIMALDTDKDGKVSVSEAGKFGMSNPQRRFVQNGQSARAGQAMTLGSKGEVTLADYQAAGEALFRKIDADNDGAISQQELVDYRRQPSASDNAARDAATDAAQKRLRDQGDASRKKVQEEARAGCMLPPPSPKAKVVLLSAYQTEALSSVTIGYQDVVVHAGRIVVEPGDEPLYVVIPTYAATLWQFSGAVDRIERLAMSSLVTGPNSGDGNQPSLVGATGLPQDRISFLSRSSCFGYFSEMPSSQSVRSVAAVREATGQEPFKVFTAYSALGFSIPSGKVESLDARRSNRLIIEKK
jgi:Ca2+-binding EF-hand superfamily protein